MSDQNAIRIVVDTNLWISFCIGTQLSSLAEAIIKKKVTLCFSDELYDELFSVLKRPKIKSKIDKEKIKDLHAILSHRITIINPPRSHSDCRDPKDNFILDLAVSAGAHYLVTGDADLLALNPFLGVKILKVREFEQIIDSFG